MTENVLIQKETAKKVVKAFEVIIETIKTPGLINVDYQDFLTLIRTSDGAMMFGKGKGEGKNRVQKAVSEALKTPENVDLLKASGALINVRGGPDMTVEEARIAIEEIHKKVNPEATTVWGASIVPELKGAVEITSIFFGIK